ncbi:hypothetical protein [Aeromonas jandaei]|uniref:hypothetical protein n=1 Tax=Aeromonas jandaei TaxID=650 RepID=UPI001ADD6F95|nr:hypothetical protein [Aeromonas jandaei]QTL95332.1 hypothetical protein AjGTCBM29_03241 [Aeromonas jandaei]
MMLTNKWKTFIRWFGMFFVLLSYYFSLGVASLSSSHVDEKESMVFLSDKTVTIEYHKAILAAMNESVNTVLSTAVIGFPIGVFLILVIFKKIR